MDVAPKTDTDTLLNELLTYQLKTINIDFKLQYSDMKRICKYIDTSIFDENVCCLWKGYVTNENNTNKGTYINFYFKKKKAALHRLLYANFVEELSNNEYLKFNCENRGKCCNIKHLKKYVYQQQNKKSKRGRVKSSSKEGVHIINRKNANDKELNTLRICFD